MRRSPAAYHKELHHASKPPVTVHSTEEQVALGPEWSEHYIHQPYPAHMYHWTKPSVLVKNAEEAAALGGGWAPREEAFKPYQERVSARTEQQDPVKWVDGWPMPSLSVKHRQLIKARLLRIDDEFWRTPDAPSAVEDCMRLAFSAIAEVLLEAGILTEQHLEKEIPGLIWDSAIAGGWWRYASGTPQSIFPEAIGHYWVWRDETTDWPRLFRVETAEFLAKLSETPTPARTTAAPTPASAVAAPVAEVRAATEPNSEVSRRKSLLADYKAATGNPSNKRIYESRNARIHKPQFYSWLKGELPADSATSRNFERFLSERKPPIPRRPRD